MIQSVAKSSVRPTDVDIGCASTTDSDNHDKRLDGHVSDSATSSSTCLQTSVKLVVAEQPPEAASVPVPWGLFADPLPMEASALPSLKLPMSNAKVPADQPRNYNTVEESQKDMLCNSLAANTVENRWLDMSQMPMAPQAPSRVPKAAKVPKVDESIVEEALEKARAARARAAMMRGRREKPDQKPKARAASNKRAGRADGSSAYPPVVTKTRLEEPEELLAKLMQDLEKRAHGSENSPESTDAEILAARADALKCIVVAVNQDQFASAARGLRSRSEAHFRVPRRVHCSASPDGRNSTEVFFAEEVGVHPSTIAEKPRSVRRSRSVKA